MKRITITLLALLTIVFTVNAQQYVSTQPANRNVIIEEFTGRNCGYCPIGHKLTHDLMEANPGRVWAINVHYQSSLSPTAFPNLNTSISSTIANAFPHNGIPMGVVNRSTASGTDVDNFTNMTNQQLGQAAECNVAGIARINPDTRVASITVEIYYTGSSTVDNNYLSIVMVQDSILGSQSDYGNYNPGGWLNGQYVHQHALRDMITPTWGESISPTTAGTLITKQYQYQIPENIGNPNGVDVRLEHISFLAFVTERQQGTPTRPILNACELEKTMLTDEPIYPSMGVVSQAVGASCSHTQTFSFGISNIGTETLTSVKFNAVAGDVTEEFEWNGNLPSGDKTNVEFTMDLPFGTYDAMLNIVEANGAAYEAHRSFVAECIEWTTVTVNDATADLKVYVIQDQFGEQTTWDIINSAGEVIASGGPYAHLIGAGATQPNVQNVDDVPANDCYMFRIYDNNNNGICCNYGNGYYYVKCNNQTIFGGEGNGDFGSEGRELFSIVNPNAVSVTTNEPRILGDHEAMFIGSIVGNAVEVGFEYSKLTAPASTTVTATLNDNNTFTATVDDLESNTMYSVTAYAVLSSGDKVYGDDVHFHTWVEGVSELENTLKVYPNPANDFLTIEGDITSVEVYSIVGQCLFAKQVNGNTRIDLSGFNNGIYFLRVYNNGEMAVRKFSVNR